MRVIVIASALALAATSAWGAPLPPPLLGAPVGAVVSLSDMGISQIARQEARTGTSNPKVVLYQEHLVQIITIKNPTLGAQQQTKLNKALGN